MPDNGVRIDLSSVGARQSAFRYRNKQTWDSVSVLCCFGPAEHGLEIVFGEDTDSESSSSGEETSGDDSAQP